MINQSPTKPISCEVSHRRSLARHKRGFIHILLLIFTILGISLWGISEIFVRSEQEKQENKKIEATSVNDARRALFDYALFAPPRQHVESGVGSYILLVEDSVTNSIPYRYFALPCPDTTAGLAGDSNLDGISDIHSLDNAANNVIVNCSLRSNLISGYSPLGYRSRTGRLPWRSFSGKSGDSYVYVHGAGNRDIRDENYDRFWYAVSRNFTRYGRTLNPHWLLRQTNDWLEARENSSNNTISRLAAIVVSPGTVGGRQGRTDVSRVPEVGEVPVPSVTSDTTSLHFAYLDTGVRGTGVSAGRCVGFDSFVLPGHCRDNVLQPLVYYDAVPQNNADDKLGFVSVDDLVKEGVEVLAGDSGGELIDILEGNNGEFLSIKEMLQAHLNRYGVLPSPATFSRESGESTIRRRSGPPAIITTLGGGRVTVQAANLDTTGRVVTLLLPVRNIREVYLQPGTGLSVTNDDFFGDGLPPYNLALYSLDTALNALPLSESTRANLIANDFYPLDNLFGYPQNTTVFAQGSTFVTVIANRVAPLDSRVRLARSPPTRNVSFLRTQEFSNTNLAHVALAAPAMAYIQGDSLSLNINLADGAGGNNTRAAESPPYGMQVRLPEGTRFSISGADTSPITIALPANIVVRGGRYDIHTNQWILQRQLPQPVQFTDNSDRFITITAALSGLPALSGNIGFLPVDNVAITVISSDSRLALETAILGVELPGTGISITAPGGVRLPREQAISNLPIDIELFTNARLIITPFPPPGRPTRYRDTPGVYNSNVAYEISNPTPLYINHLGGARANSREFTLPAGTQIYYPQATTINIGADFEFPLGTRALLPPGTTMEVEVLNDSVLPGGRRYRGVRRGIVMVTLYHGAAMDLSGREVLAGVATVSGARFVLRDGVGVGLAQEIFDIEIPHFYNIISEGTTVSINTGGVIQPLTGRSLIGSIAPMSITTATPFSLSSWTRMQFLTYARNVTFDNESTFADANLDGALISNQRRESAGMRNIVVHARIGDSADMASRITVAFRIDEQTRFMLPPDNYPDIIRIRSNIPSAFGSRQIRANFVFPPGTGIYDPEITSLENIVVDNTIGIAVLADPLTVNLVRDFAAEGITQSQLVMLPDSDIIAGDQVIPAHSVIDILQAVAWPPGAVFTLPSVAEDLQAVSDTPMYLYFPSAVTLTVRRDFSIVSDVSDVPPHFVRVEVNPPQNISVSYSINRAPDLSGRALFESSKVIAPSEPFVLPAGTFIVIPAASPLEFFSYSKHSRAVPRDYALLPRDATALTPPGQEIILPTITSAGVTVMLTIGVGDSTGVHLRLGNNEGVGFAMQSDSSAMEISPMVYYPGNTYLRDTKRIGNLTDPLAAQIPAGSRGDIFGHVTWRNGSDFAANMLPVDTESVLRNFPMVYAVASDCRADTGNAEACRDMEGDRGLQFTVTQGERIVLENDIIAEGNIVISVYSDAANVDLEYHARGLDDFNNNRDNAGTRGAVSVMIIEAGTGKVTLIGNRLIGTNVDELERGGIPNDEVSPRRMVQVFLPSGAPPDAVLRVYTNLNSSVTPQDLSNAHFAEMKTLTIYSGGYTDDRLLMTEGRISITAGFDNSGISELKLGYGAQIRGDVTGIEPFGAGSQIREVLDAAGNNITLRLDRYKIVVDPAVDAEYRLLFNAASRYADVDFAGNARYQVAVGDRIENNFSNNIAPRAITPNIITLDLSAQIEMEPGYLWQGYISPGPNGDVNLRFSENTALTRRGFADEAYLRVHPSDNLLNFWGSGQERAEGLDNRSNARTTNYINTGIEHRDLAKGNHFVERAFVRQNSNLVGFTAHGIAPHSPLDDSGYSATLAAGDPLTPGGTGTARNTKRIYAHVRNDQGVIITTFAAGRWNPNVIQRVGQIPDGITATNITTRYPFGTNNSPLPFLGESWVYDSDDVWAVRPIVNSGSQAITVPASRLVVGAITASFDPPPFQLAAKSLKYTEAVNYHKTANIYPQMASLYRCGPALIPNTILRIPGTILGSFADVERHNRGTGIGCVGGDTRNSGFSSRLRRDSILATYLDEDLLPTPSNVTVTYALSAERIEVNRLTFVTTTLQANTNYLTLTAILSRNAAPWYLQPQDLRTRITLPADVASTPNDAEVRALVNNDPTGYNPASGTLGGGVSNPKTYVVPAPRVASTVAIQPLPNLAVRDSMTYSVGRHGPKSTPMLSDMIFYLDRAYKRLDPLGQDIPQILRLGDDFRINGPGALVPHFGGRHIDAVADTYAARSRFIHGLFGNGPLADDKFRLHRVYSRLNSTRDTCPFQPGVDAAHGGCPNMYHRNNVPYWIPIISGIVAFEGVDINIESPSPSSLEETDVALVVPQPFVTAADSGGMMVTIYAGSIIYPRTGEVRRSLPILNNSRLEIIGSAVAAVDVSPVNAPQPIRYIRDGPTLQAWDFNYPPIKSGNFIIEPIAFQDKNIIDFNEPRLNLANLGVTGAWRNGAGNFDRDGTAIPIIPEDSAQGYSTFGFTKRADITATIRYDGTQARGFLMSDYMSDIMADYFKGDPVFVSDNHFYAYFPRRSYFRGSSINITAYFWHNRPPASNDVAPIGNPFSWHWLNRRREGSFIPLGGARQFVYNRALGRPAGLDRRLDFPIIFTSSSDIIDPFTGAVPKERPLTDINTSPDRSLFPNAVSNRPRPIAEDRGRPQFCGALGDIDGPRTYPDIPMPYQFLAAGISGVPCLGRDAHFWVGLRHNSIVVPLSEGPGVGTVPNISSTVYPNPRAAVQTDKDEFVSLRLPHLITIPESNITINAFNNNSQQPIYPVAVTNFFEFPNNSIANVLQVDAASWESVHPYVSRYLPGAIFANDGGFYPNPLSVGVTPAASANAIRGLLRVAEQMEVQPINDGHKRVNIGGRRVLHYTRTESAPGDQPYNSNAPVYTNVWIRLINGGKFVNIDSGTETELSPGTIVNPILGTYLPVEIEPTDAPTPELKSNYQSYAAIIGNVTIVRPALIIPKGVTMQIGANGARIDNVRAAAIFSVSPLDNIQCSFGGIGGEHILTDGVTLSVLISQSREGVSETALEDAGGGVMTLGHPCAWLDDKENIDGDRLFIYRSRRRYVSAHRARIESNDRTYLLGGKLQLL